MVTAWLLVAIAVTFVEGQTQPKSCADVYKANTSLKRGEYTIYNNNGQPFQVFCDFHGSYGYTYISPSTTVHIDMANLYTDDHHFLIRDRRPDGTQYEAKIEQISNFQGTPLSFQYNTFSGYMSPQNVKMSPYLYVGLIPKSTVRRGQVEGYRFNDQDLLFTNCDGNANSYFSFFFNQNNAQPTPYHPTNSDLQRHWVDGATRVSDTIPDSYFSFFEMHFGGCGAYGTPQHLHQVTGAALGLRYDITCTTPVNVQNAVVNSTATAVGSVVHYTCMVGYTRSSGDLSRQCAPTGQWTGSAPVCGSFPCDSKPCQNGGMCFELEGNTYVCECLEGFGGTTCEQRL